MIRAGSKLLPDTPFAPSELWFSLLFLCLLALCCCAAYRPSHLHHVFPDCRISALSASSQLLSCFLHRIAPLCFSKPFPTFFSITQFLISSPLLSPPPSSPFSMIHLSLMPSLSLSPPSMSGPPVVLFLPRLYVIKGPGGMIDFSQARNCLLLDHGGSGLCWISRSGWS